MTLNRIPTLLVVVATGLAIALDVKVTRASPTPPPPGQSLVGYTCINALCQGTVPGFDPATVPSTPISACILNADPIPYGVCTPQKDSGCGNELGANTIKTCNGTFLKGNFPVMQIAPCYAGYFSCSPVVPPGGGI